MASTDAVKFGFRTAGYREWPLDKALESIASVGYAGVEFCLEHPQARPEDLTSQRVGQLAQMVSAAGLQVASVSYHGDGEPPHERGINQEHAIQVTADMGADVLILNAEPAQAGQERRQWDALKGQLTRLLAAAQEARVTIALEPEPGHFLHSSDDMMRLLREMRHPSLGVNLDVGHAFLTDEDVPQTICSLGDNIVHTHVEGMPAGRHSHLVPGEGDLDLTRVHVTLQSIGYAGYYTVDLFQITDAPEQYARRSLEALRRITAG